MRHGLGVDRTKEGSVGTYDSLVYGLLQLLFGDLNALIVADNRFRGTWLRGGLTMLYGRAHVRKDCGLIYMRAPWLSSLPEPTRGSVRDQSLRIECKRHTEELITGSAMTGSGECSFGGSLSASTSSVCSFGAFEVGCA